MDRRWIVAPIAVACGFAALWLALHVRGSTNGEPPAARVASPTGDSPAPAAAEPTDVAATAPRRTAIPHPPRRARPPGAPVEAVSPAVAGAGADSDAADTAVEKGGVDPDLPLTPESISAVADKMRPSITACVEAWLAEVPEIDGKVVLAFRLGPDGVEDAWVIEHEAVPTPVLSCFSSAVYEQDWPAAPDGGEVTLPFVVRGGLEPPEPGSTMEDKRGP